MDSLSQHDEHESCAKRLKLDLSEPKISVLCDGSGFGEFSAFREVHIDASEGISPDCDSGYDASTMESAPTPVHITSPNTDTFDTTGDTHESLSEMADPDLEDDNVSTVSNISDLSGLSELSGQDWKPFSGSILWVQKQMSSGIDPRTLLSTLGTDLSKIPDYMDDVTLWKVIINMMAEPPRRHKLRHVNTLDDVVRLLRGSRNIIVLTGAGVSVSCGIPDFRSRDGIYSRLAVDFPDLPDPQAMFDIQYFKQDPRPFFKFAKDIYPGQFQPSPCHRFIKLLEKHNKLLRNYTQNIDTLENVAGIERVVECHGSFATASCTRCSYKVDADAIRDAVCQQRIPMCPKCMEERETVQSSDTHYKDMVSQGIMKPDIVFFGEGLPDHFHEAMVGDKSQCDLLIVIGSSLKVRPVALIPSSLPEHVPQILINREPLPHCHFDVELLGDCDIIINQLCYMLNNTWTEGCWLPEPLKETTQLLPLEKSTLPPYNISLSIPGIDENLLSSAQKLKAVTDEETESESQLVEDSNSCDKSIDETHEIQQITSTTADSSLTLGTSVKERHISIDSARDSGIGDSSNHTDTCSNTPTNTDNFDNVQLGMRDFWEPKLKRSLASRLPQNSYYLVPPSRYIFPGAEVFYDPDENYIFSDDSSESESSESDSESETGDANEFPTFNNFQSTNEV